MMGFLMVSASIAPAFTPLIALFAGIIAWRQLALNRANQRKTTAMAIFREFLRLTVQYPKLANGEARWAFPATFN
jgi:hypothetical protein